MTLDCRTPDMEETVSFGCAHKWPLGSAIRASLWLVMVTAAATVCGQSAQKKRVAVFDFANAAVQGVVSPYPQTNAPDLGKGVSALLITKLAQDDKVSVIERNAIDKILAEQNLTNSDRSDPVTAAKLGRLLGVDAIILGTITHYDYDEKVHGGGASRVLVPFSGGGVTPNAKYDIHATVQISARVVSPDTAEVLAVSQGVGETRRKAVKVDVRDMGGRILMTSGLNSPVMNDSLEKAIAQLAVQLEEQLPKLPPRTPVIEGLVANASESGRLILNVGAQHGVKVGDHLQVLRAGNEIRDPVTGKLLMRDDKLLGEAIVTSVNDVSSVAQYSGSEPAKVRDLVKSIPKQR